MRRFRSGTYEAEHGLSQPKHHALLEIEGALSDLAICLELLGHVSSGDSERAVLDAQRALKRLEQWLDQRRFSIANPAKDELRQAS